MRLDTPFIRSLLSLRCRVGYIFILAALFNWSASATAVIRAKAPNILYIVSDNQPASIMGTYGNPDVKTPNIDTLASEGIRFDQAFAVNGMCSATRATIMTGLMPSQHGVHNYLEDLKLKDWPKDWNAVREFRTLPYTLKQRGYQTALIGKWHLGQPTIPAAGIDHWLTFSVGHTVNFWKNHIIENGQEYEIEGRHIVDFFTEKAVNYIDNITNEKPFFLMVTYDGPYLNPPTNMGPGKNRYFKDYQGKKLESFPRDRIHEDILKNIDRADPGPNYKTVDEYVQNTTFDYLRMNADPDTMANVASQNTLVDDGVGQLLAALKRKGLDENTVVIYTTDQGNYYGQHGLWGHTISTFPASLYDTPMNIPLIIRYPGQVPAGEKSDLLVGQYDLAPTILDFAGSADVTLENSPGRSFADHVTGGQIESWRDAVYFEQEETRAIRTQQYSYWKRLKGTGESVLFDIQADPGQKNNLYDNPAYKAVIQTLDRKLEDFFAKYSNPAYDLWHGGTAKGSILRPDVYRGLYGEDWELTTDIKPAFTETSEANAQAQALEMRK